MENTRSYISRFSGLILFLLSLGVVGLLVFFTIRSARDNDQPNTQNTSSTTSQNTDETQDNADTASEPDPETAPAPTVTEEPAANDDENPDENESASDDDTENGTVAAETSSDNLPNTGPESVVISAVALAVLAGTIKSYLQSRRLLIEARRR